MQSKVRVYKLLAYGVVALIVGYALMIFYISPARIEQSNRLKYVSPDKLPNLSIADLQIHEERLNVKVKIEVAGDTPVLITPGRIAIQLKKLDADERGRALDILQDETFLLQPDDSYSKEISISEFQWFDGNHWAPTSIRDLKKGSYELYVAYNGTKAGLRKGDYDFKELLMSNRMEFEIEN